MRTTNLLVIILITGIIAGTCDILAATFILAGGNATGTLKFIASGAFGKTALDGGNDMVAWGLLFHYLIALTWTALFFVLYSKLRFLHFNKWLNAAGYGIIVWLIMNLLVLPMSQISQREFRLVNALENILILAVCIGIPAAQMAARIYKNVDSAAGSQ